jgi:phosphotransferase system enzyme I (PtsI)
MEREHRQHIETTLKGIAASPGIAIGKVCVFSKVLPKVVERMLEENELANEVLRLQTALLRSQKELRKILQFAEPKLGDRTKILEAQIMILEDPILIETLQKRIRAEKKNAELLVSNEIEKYQMMMLASGDDYMHERAHDMDDLKNRIIRNLQEEKLISKLESSCIIVSDTLTTADVIILSRNETLAYATDKGGITSHASLLTRSLRIPAVVGLQEIFRNVQYADTIIVDGYSGIVIIHPQQNTIDEYSEKKQRYRQHDMQFDDLHELPSKTNDGKTVELAANIEFEEEIEIATIHGADGVGLYRTESMLFGADIPDEEEQYQNYKKIAERMYPHKVIIRTFDVGGDKIGPQSIDEANPFLGWRGIRVSLDDVQLFRTQLRALLRASTKKNINILFPMITSVEEIRESKEMLNKAKDELRKEHCRFDKNIRIGVMIEVPSAVLLADEMIKEADFFSIGTNDLTQYLLAVDRGNPYVADLYHEFHPAILRAIKRTIDAAHNVGKWVSLCGEMGGNPMAIMLLVGLGVDALSVMPGLLPEVKQVIRSISYKDAKSIATTALNFSTSKEVEEFLSGMMKKKLSSGI